MKNPKLILLIAVIGFAFLNQTAHAQTVDERVARASAAVNKNDYDGALPDIEEVLKTQPANTQALNLRCFVYLNRKNYDQAIADCSNAIKSNPQYAAAYVNRGMSIIRKTNPDYNSAIADFTRAVEIVPNYASAYDQRGWIYLQLQSWSAADSDFTQAIKFGANNKEIYVNRGVVRANSDNYYYAAQDYRKALEIDPNYDLAKKDLEYSLAKQMSNQEKRELTIEQLIQRGYSSQQLKMWQEAEDYYHLVPPSARDFTFLIRHSEVLDKLNSIYEAVASAYAAVKLVPANQNAAQNYQTLLGKIPENYRSLKVEKFYADYKGLADKLDGDLQMTSTDRHRACDYLIFMDSDFRQIVLLNYMNIGLVTDEKDRNFLESKLKRIAAGNETVTAKQREIGCSPSLYYTYSDDR